MKRDGPDDEFSLKGQKLNPIHGRKKFSDVVLSVELICEIKNLPVFFYTSIVTAIVFSSLIANFVFSNV